MRENSIKYYIDYFDEKIAIVDIDKLISIKDELTNEDAYGKLFVEFLEKKYDIIKENECFELGILESFYGTVKFKQSKLVYLPYLIFHDVNIIGGRYYKVELQYCKCKECGWNGQIANPSSFEFTMFLKDKYKAMEEISLISGKLCPVCNNKLDRTALWIKAI